MLPNVLPHADSDHIPVLADEVREHFPELVLSTTIPRSVRVSEAPSYGQTVMTYDPAFMNTAACRSAITYIDGDRGILRYRGYPIEQLAEHSSFIETSYLLIYGELPSESELADFEGRIRQHTMLHEDLKGFFQGFPRDAHPMPVLSSAVSALSTFYQDSLDPFNADDVELSTIRLLAKLPTIAAYAMLGRKISPVYRARPIVFS